MSNKELLARLEYLESVTEKSIEEISEAYAIEMILTSRADG